MNDVNLSGSINGELFVRLQTVSSLEKNRSAVSWDLGMKGNVKG